MPIWAGCPRNDHREQMTSRVAPQPNGHNLTLFESARLTYKAARLEIALAGRGSRNDTACIALLCPRQLHMTTTFSQTAAYIWSLAELVRGDFKQSQYGRVILPFTILRRLECVLAPRKEAVLKEAQRLAPMKLEEDAREEFLVSLDRCKRMRLAGCEGRRGRMRDPVPSTFLRVTGKIDVRNWRAPSIDADLEPATEVEVA